MKFLKISFKVIVYGFALIGVILTAGFFAVKYNLTNVVAVVDKNSDAYQAAAQNFSYAGLSTTGSSSVATSSGDSLENINNKMAELNSSSQELANLKVKKIQELCQLDVVGKIYPVNARNIILAYQSGASQWSFDQMILALSLRAGNDSEFSNKIKACLNLKDGNYNEAQIISLFKDASSSNAFPWANDESWDVVTAAILKDEVAIKRAAADAGINPRLIVADLVVEQLRLYNTQREFYEKFFKPLQILANANKMAWGVMAIKEATAIDIENNLKNKNSFFYLGPQYENILDFVNTPDVAKARYDRLTNPKDHYYSYLYGALLIKQVINQWENKGYNISNRPELIATLFNIGFMKSSPKDNPQVGGSIITLDNVDYTFGSLAHEFYYSNLIPNFPMN
ncbi:MAG: hypothetical protein WCK37_00445 [Candidatus Falkowbacteria bacterium]